LKVSSFPPLAEGNVQNQAGCRERERGRFT
jgi:hypothetical protein